MKLFQNELVLSSLVYCCQESGSCILNHVKFIDHLEGKEEFSFTARDAAGELAKLGEIPWTVPAILVSRIIAGYTSDYDIPSFKHHEKRGQKSIQIHRKFTCTNLHEWVNI